MWLRRKTAQSDRQITSSRGWLFLDSDVRLLAVTVILVALGLVIVYDASVIQAFRDFNDKYYYLRAQSIWVILGFISLTFFYYFPYRLFQKIALPIFVISLVLLLAVFVPGLGFAAGGAHRWLKLGFFTLQPTEIIKLTTIIFLSSLFQKNRQIMPFAMITLFISVIIGIFQKDLGSTIVFFISSLMVFVMSGVPLRFLVWAAPAGLVAFLVFVMTSEYRQQRILAFLDPFSDPQGYTYHISQVLIALGTGGWFGLGLGQSRQKFEFIPEVTTDSIFAIVGEEFGFVGGLVLIGLLSYLIYRGFRIAEHTSDKFGRLLAFGLVFWLGLQSAINLAAMVSLIPLTGVPLPFISYGGSALLTNLIAVGILLNIAKDKTEANRRG